MQGRPVNVQKAGKRKQAATKGKKANPSPAYLLVATSIVDTGGSTRSLHGLNLQIITLILVILG
jgi:hypothetical protein